MKTLTVLLVLISFGCLIAGLYWSVRTMKMGKKASNEAKKAISFLVGGFAVFMLAALVEDDKKPEAALQEQVESVSTVGTVSSEAAIAEVPQADADVLVYLDQLGTDPKSMSGDCMDMGSGISCTWEANKYFERADSTQRTPDDYTILIVNPTFTNSDVPEGILNGPGGLNGGHAHYVTTNSGQVNLSISSAANYQRLHQ